MTIQVLTRSAQASKAALKTSPGRVLFYEPSIVGSRTFTGASVRIGEKFPVVMDHETRRRFATVARTATGWRVG